MNAPLTNPEIWVNAMYCSNCGAELRDDAAFCEQCGAPRRARSVDAPVVVNDNPFAADLPGTPTPLTGPLPSDYLVQNLLVTAFACPLGIVGVIFSILAKRAKSSGDAVKYMSNAQNAKLCFGIALSFGMGAYAVGFLVGCLKLLAIAGA